ncbi:hypothetical protein [Bradyrhizobium erythrophlei]|jgi:hypothetical protein|uniref:Uncharacterized protein n=1 Tax=Bradyrhizobium erythrophlei TaxID=1437360 RepID=A0A1M5NGE8_9BRAD|nr:hypothetical protein [Bradyrhizobium erythrophlei]SHG88588.1 hypothetical protein SAMN05443248_2986 [Bradyrhizobium erythrophlei]
MSNIGPLIDDYGLLKAQIAELETKLKPLHEQIVAQGEGAYEGTFYRVTVSESERANLNMKKARAKLSPQFIRANTTYTPVTTVRVSGRNAIDVETEGGQ